MNIPLPPGAGHETYLDAMERLVVPALDAFAPDVIIVACGFDASVVDPLSRMMLSAESFAAMTRQVMAVADRHCKGRVVMAHEGGYSELHVPFCGHAVLEVMSGSEIRALDPLAARAAAQQPDEEMIVAMSNRIDKYLRHFGLA